MKHRKKNIKFRDGKDSDKMIVRKLMRNFIVSAGLVTTETKAKALKIYLDRVISKTRETTESNKNYVLSYFPEKKMIDVLFNQVGPAVKDINGGYVKLTRLNQRENDGAMMVRVDWAHPVVIDWKPKKQDTAVAETNVKKEPPSSKTSASQAKSKAKKSTKSTKSSKEEK